MTQGTEPPAPKQAPAAFPHLPGPAGTSPVRRSTRTGLGLALHLRSCLPITLCVRSAIRWGSPAALTICSGSSPARWSVCCCSTSPMLPREDFAAHTFHHHHLPVLRRQHPAVCDRAAFRRRRADHLDRACVLHLDLNFQPVRRVGVLGAYRGHLQFRARQAAVRFHRGWSNHWSDYRLDYHRNLRPACADTADAGRCDHLDRSRGFQRAAFVAAVGGA